ncbi:PDDEXK family nuclease [Gloeocapsopsis crepidinum]|uniref:hypothetical protein n=1 Tax=Gloeocapsopsis crepidinum TaxID=693223 RepID=UPI0030D9AE09
MGSKMKDYARIGVAYYVVYDPLQQLGNRLLRVHELRGTNDTELVNDLDGTSRFRIDFIERNL